MSTDDRLARIQTALDAITARMVTREDLAETRAAIMARIDLLQGLPTVRHPIGDAGSVLTQEQAALLANATPDQAAAMRAIALDALAEHFPKERPPVA